ncbi:hypothetical protein [Shewanella aestuarii]|uniref:LPP20 family lipoprotein n=1 Tax=Shewanella aestuarii TaxID=1028752 RepID=A0A6G9QP95_9GAMM|nr:hypothetical protein [Shewanella aestuarii]QIR16312.1 hypothetical protein HBH39_17655 [Shewanella aestuarii]
MKKILSIVSFASVVVLAGCASEPDPVERFNEQQAKANELAVEQAKEQLSNVPKWYLSPPKNDNFGIVGVGAASSKDMHHAVKKSKLQAEFELAKNYKQELSGSERIYEREGASGELVQTSQFLIDKLVDSVPVVGYEMLDQQVKVNVDGSFQVYTLLKLPYDEFNKVLQRTKAESQDAKELAAFDDLERRLEAKRLRKDKELERDHERKLELMDAQNGVIGAESVAEPVVNTQANAQPSNALSQIVKSVTN